MLVVSVAFLRFFFRHHCNTTSITASSSIKIIKKYSAHIQALHTPLRYGFFMRVYSASSSIKIIKKYSAHIQALPHSLALRNVCVSVYFAFMFRHHCNTTSITASSSIKIIKKYSAHIQALPHSLALRIFYACVFCAFLSSSL